MTSTIFKDVQGSIQEGTWFPVLGFGAPNPAGKSFLINQGKFTKLDILVLIEFDIQLDFKGLQTGQVFVGNLPFPCVGSTGGNTLAHWEQMAVPFTYITTRTNDGLNSFTLEGALGPVNSLIVLNDSHFGQGSRITGNFCYTTNG